jgi:hypothetical protein
VFASMDDWYRSPHSREFATKLERMARLGRALRFQHDQIVWQPLPQELQQLMRRLEGVDR